jgi:ABC-2 type transport system ATP-binding protein
MISTYGLTKRFGRRTAVDSLTLEVPKGSALALVGSNGAGKTTTIQMLMNILSPTAGTATILDTDSTRIGPEQLARIGYVSENQRLPGGLTVDQFLAYLRPMYKRWDPALEAELRSNLRLPGDVKIKHLSHGTRIKLALAAALAYRPELLILDEPLSGLDPFARDEFMEGVLRQAGETTVLLSSHELSEIETSLTHVAFLEAGRLMFSEPLADLRQRFRKVQVTLPDNAHPSTPGTWLSVEAAGNVVRFIEPQFEESTLGDAVHRVFGEVRSIHTEPMDLRSIFVELARERAKGAAAK